MYSEKIIQTNNGSFQLRTGLNGTRCGWICRKIRSIANFVGNIPIIGGSLADKLNIAADIISEVESLFKMAANEYEPTSSESVILDSWQLKLQSFYRTVSNDLADSYNENNFSNQITVINDILSKMCIIKGYFLNNEKAGLSLQALQLRNELIDKIFEPHYEIIEETFANIEIDTITVTSVLNNQTINDYYPVIMGNMNLNYQCLNYRINASTQITSNANPVPLVITNTNDSPQTVINSNNNSLVWVGVFIAGILAITVFNNDKEKNKD